MDIYEIIEKAFTQDIILLNSFEASRNRGISNKGLNTWTLDKKKQYLESLRIQHYMEYHARGKDYYDKVIEIFFSDDCKYIYLCISYLGKLK